jgi:signal transduction histidine kinase/CheY-like chemotaxis protein
MKYLFDFSSLASEGEIENDQLRKEVYLKYFNFFAALFTLFYTFISWFIDYKQGIYLTLAVFCSFVLVGIVSKKKVPLIVRSNWFILTGAIDIYFNALFTGGVHSPVTAWLVFLPLLPLILSHFINAMVWMIISVSLVTSLYFLEDYQKMLIPAAVQKYMALFEYAVFGGLVVLVFCISSLFDSLKNIALTTLDNRNRQLDKAKAELIEAQRYKDRFIATVSHELRSPMNAILGVTDILRNSETDKTKFELLDGMKRSADNLLLLINDILDLSRIQAGKARLTEADFNFRLITQGAVNIFQPRAREKGIELNLKIDEAIPLVLHGDGGRLTQVITNLVGNAIKFTHQGAVQVNISATEIKADSLLLHIQVQDTGIGIPADKLGKIFEDFEQAGENITRNYGGTGLGLTITRQVAELLGGEIAVESALGTGSIFSVRVPLKIATSQSLKEHVNFDPLMLEKLKGVKILLAEDSAINRLVARKQLEQLIKEFQLDLAFDGEEALNRIKAETYDVVLMDVLMPKMSGLDVTRILRKQQNRVKIIAMTASVMENEVKECFDAGMDEFIAKPFDKYELVRKIYLQIYPN